VRTVVARHLERPIGVAIDAEARLLVAEERAARVVRIDAGGRTPVARGITQPHWLAVGENGTLYVSARRLGRDAEPEPDDESAEPQVILALTPEGVLSVFADGFAALQGLAVHGGAVHAVTSGRRSAPVRDGVVYRLPILADGSSGPLHAVATGVLRRPVGIVADRLGALYVSAPTTQVDGDRARHAIVKLDPDGSVTTFASRLTAPCGLALDRHGNLYVADGERILRFLAPPAPRVAAVPRFTNQAILGLTGLVVPDARVDVLLHHGPRATTLATPEGAFAVNTSLAPNAESAITVLATAAAGDGLTSGPAELAVVHDTIAPVASLLTPPPGGVVRGAVLVQAEAADAGSDVAAVEMSAAGRRLDGALAPAPPAPLVGATATWPTADATDGAHTLTMAAIDRAGNRAALGRLVIVDNTPPETEITAGPIGTITQPTATFIFAATDNLTPATSLQYSWRLDGGPWSGFASETTVTVTGLTAGSHLFEVFARDLAGNEDATPAARAFTRTPAAAVLVTIMEPPAGATVPTGTIVAQGTADPEAAGIAVNGVVALVHGSRWAAEIPIRAGHNAITVVAIVESGAEATASVAVTGSAVESAVTLRAEPASGVAPLTVTWRITNRTGRPLAGFELDRDGHGVFGAPTTSLDGTQTVYSAAGLFVAAVRATDDQGNVHVARTVVHVDDALSASARFQGLWTGFTARLVAGDPSGALSYLSPGLRPRFERVFADLGPDLPAVAALLGPIELIHAAEHLAEAALVQAEGGTPFLYFVYFRRDNRGRWLIHEM